MHDMCHPKTGYGYSYEITLVSSAFKPYTLLIDEKNITLKIIFP
jgi:hypothetical protein